MGDRVVHHFASQNLQWVHFASQNLEWAHFASQNLGFSRKDDWSGERLRVINDSGNDKLMPSDK